MERRVLELYCFNRTLLESIAAGMKDNEFAHPIFELGTTDVISN